MKHFFLPSILLLITSVSFSQSTNFTVYVINPTNCLYTFAGTWYDTAGVGNITWNSVDTTSSFQDVWSATVQSNTSTDSMTICVVPVCFCPQVCITVPISLSSAFILI